jgi:hypothetical protein
MEYCRMALSLTKSEVSRGADSIKVDKEIVMITCFCVRKIIYERCEGQKGFIVGA